MTVDTFGGWHPTALETLSKLRRQLARVKGREENETVRHLRHLCHLCHLYQRLALVFVRGNKNMLLSRTPVTTQWF